MAIPSQGLIVCKGCGANARPHAGKGRYCEPCAKQKQVDYQRAYRERLKAVDRLVSCGVCGQSFSTKGNGRTWRCPSCILDYQRERAATRKERYAEYSRAYRARHADQYREKMVQRRRELVASLTEEELVEFRRKEAEKSRRLNLALREEVFAAYGGNLCTCCGEQEPMFLTIDHVDNDGAKMRREGVHSRGGTQFYQWLRKNRFPPGFQVLCMNCNLGKHRNGGTCPHQSSKV
jgi:hypothetical protein